PCFDWESQGTLIEIVCASGIVMILTASTQNPGDPIEFFLRIVVDDNLPAIGGLDAEEDDRAEPLVQVGFQLQQVGRLGLVRVCLVAADPGSSRRGNARGDQGFGLADREVLGNDSPARSTLAVRVGQGKEGSGVTLSN